MAKIDEEIECAEFEERCGDGGWSRGAKALRAVVELCNFLDKKGRCCVPVQEVIDAIEKELGNG
jgi:hypothetical protein